MVSVLSIETEAGHRHPDKIIYTVMAKTTALVLALISKHGLTRCDKLDVLQLQFWVTMMSSAAT